MKKIKQILDETKVKDDATENHLRQIVECGLLEEDKLDLVKRALTNDVITEAERKALTKLADDMILEILSEKTPDYLSKYDDRKEKNAKDIPAIIILKRKAIRVFPDNQRIALYYSQQLDRYISIPYGSGSNSLGMEINEARRTPKDVHFEPIRPSTINDLPRGPWKDIAKVVGTHDHQMDAKIRVASNLSQREILSLPDGNEVLKQLIRRVPDLSTRAGLHLARHINRSIVAVKRHREMRSIKKSDEDDLKMVQPRDKGKFAPMLPQRNIVKKTAPKPAADAGTPEKKLSEQYLKEISVGALQNYLKLTKDPNTVRKNKTLTPAEREQERNLARAKIRARLGRPGPDVVPAGPNVNKVVVVQQQAPVNPKNVLDKKPRNQSNSGGGIIKDIGRATETAFRTPEQLSSFSQAGHQLAGLSGPQRVTADTAAAAATQRNFGTNPYVPQRASPQPMQESKNNLNVIRTIAEQDQSQDILVAGSYINMNPKVAKKIIKIYENLNKRNKEKMERMLNESATSFRKAVNFAVLR